MSDEEPQEPTTPLAAELDRLAVASASEELARAHRMLQRAIRKNRRRAAEGPLAQTYVAAMGQWDEQKAAGISREERISQFTKIFRAAWPKGREWFYTCTRCNDTGWAEGRCTSEARCEGTSTRTDFPKQNPGKYLKFCAKFPESNYVHDYVVACFCEKGRQVQNALAPVRPTPDDFTASGKMTRIGRRK